MAPARLHHFQPLDLGTALITVYKDSSQCRALIGKAASAGTDTFALWSGNFRGSKAPFWASADHFRSAPNSGHS
jgi:hypothetical protein